MYIFDLWFSLDIYPGVGFLDHTVTLFFSFLRNLHTVLHSKPLYQINNPEKESDLLKFTQLHNSEGISLLCPQLTIRKTGLLFAFHQVSRGSTQSKAITET